MNKVQSKHRIQKCRRIDYSSILMLKFSTSLASMDKIQYDFYLELNLARMISTKQKNVFTAIYEYRLHGTQRYVSQPQRRRREFAYKFQIQYRNIKRNQQQNTLQFYPLQHPLQISGKTDFCQATRKVYGSRLNKPLSERVINGRCQDIAHARACRHFDDI